MPTSVSSRVTTVCSGSGTSAARLPTSPICPPRRTQPIAVASGFAAPTTSSATSTPRPPVRSSTAATASHFAALNVAVAPSSAASRSRSSSKSIAITSSQPAILQRLDHQQADHAAADHDRAVAQIDPQPSHRVQRHRHRLDQRRMLERQIARHGINRLLRHDDEFGKRALLAKLVAGDAQNPPPGAHVRLPVAAQLALAAGEQRIERHMVARPRRCVTFAPTSATTPADSCPITSGGIRRPVEPSYPCTSLPQMPQARTLTSTSSGPTVGRSSDVSSSLRYSVSSSACISYVRLSSLTARGRVSLERLTY